MYDEQIKKVISKPSQALTAMINGLINQDANENFRINMMDFGSISREYEDTKPICFGCAATCTLIDLFQIEPCELISANRKLSKFEMAIDLSRRGFLLDLFGFFSVSYKFDSIKYNGRFYLETHNWKEQLPEVRKLIHELQEAGL